MRPQPRDLALNAKHRLRDLTDDHVDLIRIGRSDDHVGVAGPGPFKHVRIARKSGDPLHIQRFGSAAHQVGIAVDNRDIIALSGKMPRNLPADLPCAADDHFHRRFLDAAISDVKPAPTFTEIALILIDIGDPPPRLG